MPRSLLAVTLLLLLIPCLAQAQFQAQAPAAEATPDPAVQKPAFDLLETIAGQIANLRTPNNRVHVAAVVGDLLWSRDEKRARSLFKAAAADLVALQADLDFSDSQAYQEVSLINQERQEVVDRLAAHDPDMALSFVRETRLDQAVNDNSQGWYRQNETNLELHLAELIAQRDPARALKLARATLSRGVAYSTNALLSQIQQKDPAIAKTLYREMIDRIKDEDLGHDQEMSGAAWNLVASFQPPQANEDVYRELIEALSSATLSVTPNDRMSINFSQNLSNQLQSVMPQIEKYAAARASALRQWSQSVERSLDPSARMYQEINELAQHGTVDDILTLASRYGPDLRNQVYQNAAWKAFSSGDAPRARQIINDLVSDPIQRRQMLEQFDSQTLNTAASEGKVAAVRQLLTKIKAPDRKVQILVQLAANLAAKGDKNAALDVLNEARSIAAGTRGSMQMWAQLSLVQAYAALDSDQSFAIMQTLIVKANELVAAAAVLDGFENQYLRRGEWMTPGQSGVSNLMNTLNLSLASLAHYDLGRARALAEQLERPEVRLMAELEIVQAALGGRSTNLRLPMNGRRFVSMEGE